MPADELTPVEASIPQPIPSQRRGMAPLWHTALLVLAILGFSAWGATRTAGLGGEPMGTFATSNLLHYTLSGTLELLIVGWVLLGLRLRKTPFRLLLGALPKGLNNITMEVGVSALFWIGSMCVLAVVAIAWNAGETAIYQHHIKSEAQQSTQGSTKGSGPGAASTPAQPVKEKSPQQNRVEMVRKLMVLAPSNGIEVAAWAALCLIVGFSEELVFRGYLQLQSISLLGRVSLGVLVSSLVFGAAHGYQGLRGVCIITVYGALFSGIALLRRSLLPGMIAHSWHDFATGMALALIRSTHLLDKLPASF